MPLDQRREAAHAAALHLQNHPLFHASRHIACYYTCGAEFQTLPLMEAIWAADKICYLPSLSDNKTLQFHQYKKNDELQLNQYSIPEPVNTLIIHPEKLDLVLLPMVAFDHQGHRVGTGGGYYDRTFAFMFTHPAKAPILIGVGYEAQFCDHIKPEPWDISIKGVLTEKALSLF